MKRTLAVLTALLTVTAFAPAAVAITNTADARIASHFPPSVVNADSGLTGELVELAGMPLGTGTHVRASVAVTNPTASAIDDVVLRLDLTHEPLEDRSELRAFLDDPATIPQRTGAQEPPAPEPSTPEPPDPDGEDASEVDSDVDTAREATTERAASDTDTATSSDDNVDGTAADADSEPPPPVGISIAAGAEATFTINATLADLELPAKGWGVYGATVTLVAGDIETPIDHFPLTWGTDQIPSLDLAVLASAYGAPSRARAVLETSNLPGVAVAVDPTVLSNAMVFSADLMEREVLRLPGTTPDLTSLAHANDETLLPFALSLPPGTNLPVFTDSPWIATPAALDAQSISYASQLGAAAVLARPSAAGFGALENAADTPLVRADGHRLLVPDASLSETVTQFRPGTLAAQARAIAESALLAHESDGGPALVVLDGAWQTGAGAQSTLSALLAAPWVNTTPVMDLLGGRSTPVGVTEVLDSGADLVPEDIEALATRLAQLTVLSTVADDPDTALAQWGGDLLAGANSLARGDSATRDVAMRTALTQADETLSALRLTESSDLNLLAESGDIPITIVNGLEHDLTVTVDLTSFSPNLQVLDSPVVTVPAESEHVALVAVEAVSNANVQVATVLRNAEGKVVSEGQSFAVRVRADWGNAATAVFTVVLVLLLVAGVVRTIRRGRKDTRIDPAMTTAPTVPSPADAPTTPSPTPPATNPAPSRDDDG